MRKKISILLALAMIGLAPTAFGLTLEFSGATSDSTPPEDVTATVVYSYSPIDALSGTFTMTIFNTTSDPAYTISTMHFNTSDDITGLTLTGNGGFSGATLSSPPPPINSGGFGSFDWSLDLGTGNTGITAGNNATFTFAVTGSNLDVGDFFSHLSPGANEAYDVALIHFTRGPNGDSAWATPKDIIPEPATMSLMGLGLAGLLFRRALRKQK